MKLPITVIVLAYDEEANLPRCLSRVKDHVEDVVVVTNADERGTDTTSDIAARFGARVFTHAYMNQAQQFDWALQNVDVKTPWILKLDADEWVTDDLWHELEEKLGSTPEDVTGYFIKRRVIFMGRWIRFGGYYPSWFLRLFRRGASRTDGREVDEHLVLTEGKAAKLQNDFVDENMKGLSEWIKKHNDYASREAAQSKALDSQGFGNPEGSRNLERSSRRTRLVRRSLYAKLPLFLRAILYWKYRYFIRLGFLDGVEGFVYHALQGLWYRFLIDAKIRETKHESSH